jgi:hypothetical protein
MLNGARTEPAIDPRPAPGLSSKMPQYPAGMRMVPPMPTTAPSVARSAASPPEVPPAVCVVDHGLEVRPQIGFALSWPNSVCSTFVLEMTMAPAARNVVTTYSWGGGQTTEIIERRCWKRKRQETEGGRHRTASRLAGLFAHCVNPIALSKSLTLTRNHPRDFPLMVSTMYTQIRSLVSKE